MDLLDDDGLLDLRRGDRTDPKALMEELARRRTSTPAINDALAQWAAEAKVDADGPVVHHGQARCHLCGGKPRLTCAGCDKPACASDAWVMLGLCSQCADPAGARRMRQEG